MHITTKTGDKGTTQISVDKRVSKGSLLVEFMGNIDEIQVILGASDQFTPEVASKLVQLQKDIFSVASFFYNQTNTLPHMITQLEQWQDGLLKMMHLEYQWHLTTPQTYILDEARVRVRRAERTLVRMKDEHIVGDEANDALIYLNRLSDLLWVFGRFVKQKPYNPSQKTKESLV
ncbi:MAG: hypothetical protein ACMXYC_01800 [Candidatus Woesearchaeota archaeon]